MILILVHVQFRWVGRLAFNILCVKWVKWALTQHNKHMPLLSSICSKFNRIFRNGTRKLHMFRSDFRAHVKSHLWRCFLRVENVEKLETITPPTTIILCLEFHVHVELYTYKSMGMVYMCPDQVKNVLYATIAQQNKSHWFLLRRLYTALRTIYDGNVSFRAQSQYGSLTLVQYVSHSI